MPTITDNAFDPQLVGLAQQGDQTARREIYLHFAPQVYRLARHILQCEASAEEVVQDCFVDVLGKIESFRHQGSFAGWLRRIAVNHCLMILRSSWVKKRGDLRDDELAESFEHSYADRHTSKALNHALAKLPAKARAVLWLHDVEGYTHAEIAKLMGKTASFSKSQLARAHEKLRSYLSTGNDLSRNPTTKDSSTKDPTTKNPLRENPVPEQKGDKLCMSLLNNY